MMYDSSGTSFGMGLIRRIQCTISQPNEQKNTINNKPQPDRCPKLGIRGTYD